MHRVALLALLLQLNFIHLILKNNLSFIAHTVLLDYTAQLGLLPFILLGPYPAERCESVQDTTRPSAGAPAGLVCFRPGLLCCHQACEGPRVCLGTGLWVFLKHSAASDRL